MLILAQLRSNVVNTVLGHHRENCRNWIYSRIPEMVKSFIVVGGPPKKANCGLHCAWLRIYEIIFFYCAFKIYGLSERLCGRMRALFLFFVSRRIASRIHEISDLKKKALVLSLGAEYTRLRDQKKTYWTREERETVTDFGRVLEKGGQVYCQRRQPPRSVRGGV